MLLAPYNADRKPRKTRAQLVAETRDLLDRMDRVLAARKAARKGA